MSTSFPKWNQSLFDQSPSIYGRDNYQWPSELPALALGCLRRLLHTLKRQSLSPLRQKPSVSSGQHSLLEVTVLTALSVTACGLETPATNSSSCFVQKEPPALPSSHAGQLDAWRTAFLSLPSSRGVASWLRTAKQKQKCQATMSENSPWERTDMATSTLHPFFSSSAITRLEGSDTMDHDDSGHTPGKVELAAVKSQNSSTITWQTSLYLVWGHDVFEIFCYVQIH